MADREALLSDGFDLTVELDCGDTLRLRELPDEGANPQRGDYFSCSKHSQQYGFDPATGEAEYERDRQAVEVRREQ